MDIQYHDMKTCTPFSHEGAIAPGRGHKKSHIQRSGGYSVMAIPSFSLLSSTMKSGLIIFTLAAALFPAPSDARVCTEDELKQVQNKVCKK